VHVEHDETHYDRHQEITAIGESCCGGCPDEGVTDKPTTEGCGYGEEEHAEQIETFADASEGSGDSEDGNSDEVEDE
jgi:hypothetical protein